MKRHVLVIILVLFSPTAAWSQDQDKTDWPVPRGSSNEPVPYHYNPAILKTVPRAFFDDAAACILYVASSHRVQADGTIETVSHDITRLGSRKGIDHLGEYQGITFNPNYQKLVLNLARIHKKNGAVVPIEPRHVQLRDVATDYQVYESDKQLVISFPNLEVGDVYEVKWTVRGKNPEFGDQFFTRYTFGDDRYPTVREEMHVVIPRDKPFKFGIVNGKLEQSIKETETHRHYQWSVTNRPALPKEDDRPSLEDLRLQLAVSTFASWDEVGRWKQKLRQECWTCGPQLQKVVEEIAGPRPTPLAKARALTYWVRRQVRYVSRGPGGAGYTPHLPDQVLANRYGDCKDQAQLLAVMLKQIGLPVFLVTLGTLDDGQILPDVPSPWGTHAILLVKIAGKDHWIDTTASRAAWDYLPRGDRNRQVYVTKDDQISLMRTPAFTWEDNRYEHVTDVYVASDGTATLHRRTHYFQAAALNRRDAWLEAPPGELRRQMVAELQDAFTRARLSYLRIDDNRLQDFDEPVTARVEFQVSRHFSGEENKEGSLTDSVVWGRLLAYSVDPDRTLPMQLPGPFSSVHRYRIYLPALFRFDGLPQEKDITSRWGHFKLKVIEQPDDPHSIELVMETRLEKDVVDPAHFAEYQIFRDEVNRAYRVWLNFKPTHNRADAAMLETLLTLAPGHDLLTVQTLAKIHLERGEKAAARHVLDENLLYHMDNRGLWEMRVRACANLAEEERTYRSMIGLFPGHLQYQLLLGGLLVRRDDHAGARKVLLPLTEAKSATIGGQAYLQLARSHFNTKEYMASLRHLEYAAAVDADGMATGDTQHFLAQVHEKLGNRPQALTALRRAVTLDPESRIILGDCIRLEISLADPGALDHVRKFTMLAGKNRTALVEAADFHFQLNRLEDAFELAKRSRDAGSSGKAERIIGLIHFRQARFKDAISHLERADEDVQVNDALLRSHLALGELTAAEGRLEKLSKTNLALDGLKKQVRELARSRQDILAKLVLPEEKKPAGQRSADAFVCAELAYRENGLGGRAGELLTQAFAEDIALGQAHALRGLLLLEQGKSALALAEVEKAFVLNTADTRAHLVRGRGRLQRGNLLGGLADLEQAKQLSSGKDAQILHWLAAAQFQAGQRNRALLTQREAVELRPRDEEMQAQLREFEMELTKDVR
jgi:tetratricopeptide (TPR) repeat protein/transglutaminase-like putative cysteine protease